MIQLHARPGTLLIRMLRSVAGGFHEYSDLVAGDVVTLDASHANRYIATGTAERVTKRTDLRAHWRTDVAGAWIACRRCFSPIIIDVDTWTTRHVITPAGGEAWYRPEHERCVP